MGAALISKEEVLEKLTKVFREDGFDSATLARLSEGTGLKRASLYHYFPQGKEQMALEVLERANQKFENLIVNPLRSSAPAVEKLRQMIANLDVYYLSGRQSCLLGILAMGSHTELFQEKIQEAISSWGGALSSVLSQVGAADPTQQAEDIIFRIEGALLVVRGTGKPELFKDLLSRLLTELIPS